ncbi:2-oxoglutarate-dependent dioxygenase DAO-like [Diospyros lotus]|uniref:2-oxoglutarate-dependent dioxygenase DAO-like n=1 Tax=Diospyros lotus TaxID=55363 RepID=UPI00225662F6|nr:2-oxoglutarate-dependent dioxygenase DAO-like [Diospyros lotus]
MEKAVGNCIPVIDVKEFANPSELEKLMEACRDWGCFRIVNHGLPPALMWEMKTVARALLDQPEEIKQRNVQPVIQGYTPTQHGGPLFEALGCYDMGSPSNIDAFCSILDASPLQRETIGKYCEAIREVALQIGRKMAEGMGVAGDQSFEEWALELRINKYNNTAEHVGTTGLNVHTDPGFLTILQDDENVGGLEMLYKLTGEFVTVPPMAGSLVVNLGDLATLWSNGRLWSVKHRVQCYEASTRVSLGCFMMGPKDREVAPPPELVDSDHPAVFTPINFVDFRKLRKENRLFSDGFDLLRVSSA